MPRLLRLCAAFLLLSFVAPSLASAQDDVIPPRVLIRKFPEGQFCALPVSISFTAPAVPVIIRYRALQFVNEGASGLVWTEQSIDNVTIAPTSVVAANFSGPPSGSSSQNCYVGDLSPVSYFHFNGSGLSINVLERFDTNPVVRGWDLSDGAFFISNRSAPRNVDADNDATGGSVGLGDGSGTPTVGATASASLLVSGLTPGTSYDLGAWWRAGHVHFPHDVDYLTVTITTVGGTPVARRSWGSVKSGYR